MSYTVIDGVVICFYWILKQVHNCNHNTTLWFVACLWYRLPDAEPSSIGCECCPPSHWQLPQDGSVPVGVPR